MCPRLTSWSPSLGRSLSGSRPSSMWRFGAPSPKRGSNPPGGSDCSPGRVSNGFEALHLEPINSYLRLMAALKEDLCLISLKLKHIAAGDQEIKLPTTTSDVGYQHGGPRKGRGGRHRPVPDRGPFLQLRRHRPVQLQQRRSHPPGRITQEGSARLK